MGKGEARRQLGRARSQTVEVVGTKPWGSLNGTSWVSGASAGLYSREWPLEDSL